jgi:propanol-preferring alcohol dehydrogenase
MGIAAVMVAVGLGASVYAVDIIESRLRHAEDLGASRVINAETEVVDAVINSLTNGQGVSISIDCSGSPSGQNSALNIVAKLGSMAFVGESRATEINPSDQIIRKLLKVYGGWYFALHEWDAITDFVIRKKVPVESMITHRYPLADAAEAFASFNRRETEKSVFIWD